jgi:hypothetical protein
MAWLVWLGMILAAMIISVSLVQRKGFGFSFASMRRRLMAAFVREEPLSTRRLLRTPPFETVRPPLQRMRGRWISEESRA